MGGEGGEWEVEVAGDEGVDGGEVGGMIAATGEWMRDKVGGGELVGGVGFDEEPVEGNVFERLALTVFSAASVIAGE